MVKNKKNIWFKAKEYGWGWYPINWEGWTVVLSYVLLIFTSSIMFVQETVGIQFPMAVVILSLILLIVSYLKGEKPSWRWGKKF